MSCLCTLHVQDTGRGARQVVGLQVQILQRGEPVERGELKLILDNKLTRVHVHVSKMRCKLSLDLPDYLMHGIVGSALPFCYMPGV